MDGTSSNATLSTKPHAPLVPLLSAFAFVVLVPLYVFLLPYQTQDNTNSLTHTSHTLSAPTQNLINHLTPPPRSAHFSPNLPYPIQRLQLATMARAPTMVIQEDYIDMDLTPTTLPLPPSSPHCGHREFEFQSAATGGGASKHREAAFASPADELFYRGNLLPLHLPPRLQLVQKLLQEQQVQVQEIKKPTNAAALACADAEVEEDMTKVCAKKYSWSKRLKLMKRWTSREYIKSLFLAKPTDIGIGNGNSGGGRGSVLDQEGLCSHRKSFSGIIRRVRQVATKAAAPPGASPLCSSSSSSSSSTPSCGNANGFFLRTTTPALKRSSSARSEEGAIQGAIAHCKRSQQQQQQGMISARRSVSDVLFYSVANTPRVSSVAAANDAAQERQEMCRG